MKISDSGLSRGVRQFLLLCLVFVSAPTPAFEWSSTNVQALYGEDFILGEKRQSTFTLENADGWAYGDNFFFLDLYQHIKPNGLNFEAYGEWYSHLSLKKTLGWSPPVPGIKDVSISLGFNGGSNPGNDPFKAYLGGLRFDVDVPGFDFLQLYFHAYKNDNNPSEGLQITPVWSVPVRVGDLRFKLRGFMDISTSETGAGSWHLLTQPQVLWDVGALQGQPDKLMVGIEWWYWKNKYGLRGQTESAPQAALVYFF
jgi:nucleoside-specific outer membrane channel protein Tsx